MPPGSRQGDGAVVPLSAPTDARRETLLEGSGPRGIISAEAHARDADASAIDVGAPLQIVDAWGRCTFSLWEAVQATQTQRLADTRMVDEQNRDTPRRKLAAQAKQIKVLLRDIEAAEEN